MAGTCDEASRPACCSLAGGVRRLGVRLGNWLTPEQGKTLLAAFEPATLRGKRDRAMVAMLLGCGLRRSELLSLTVKTIQQRQAPLSGSPAKRISEKNCSFITFYFYVLSLEYPQALSSSI